MGKLFYFRKWFWIMCCLWKIVVAYKNPPQFTPLSGQLEHYSLLHLHSCQGLLWIHLQLLFSCTSYWWFCCAAFLVSSENTEKFQVYTHRLNSTDICLRNCHGSWPRMTETGLVMSSEVQGEIRVPQQGLCFDLFYWNRLEEWGVLLSSIKKWKTSVSSCGENQ